MVGTGVVVGGDGCGNGLGVTPGDHRVDQPVAPAPADVVVAEAEGAQVLRVVGQAEVGAGVAPGQLPGPGRVRLEDDGDLGRQQGPGPRMSRARAVCSTGTK